MEGEDISDGDVRLCEVADLWPCDSDAKLVSEDILVHFQL
jgi:hypothetical protein